MNTTVTKKCGMAEAPIANLALLKGRKRGDKITKIVLETPIYEAHTGFPCLTTYSYLRGKMAVVQFVV